MIIRNSKNLADQEARRQQALKLLEIEASNEAFLDARVSKYRNPTEPPEVPPRYRDASEIAQDILGNQMSLISLLTKWGFTAGKATAIVKNIKSNDEILKILQSANNLKRRLDSYDKSLLSVEFVSNVIEKFLANYDKTLGGNMVDALEMLLSNWLNAKRVFPTMEQINMLKSRLAELRTLKERAGLNVVELNESIESLNRYEKLLPIIEEYETLRDSGLKDEAVAEMKALLSKGNIPLAQNINQYIRTVNELLDMAKTVGLNRADTNAKISNINDALKYTITPEALAIVDEMRKKYNLPVSANTADVLIQAQKREESLREETQKLNEIKEQQYLALKKVELENVVKGAYIKGNANADIMRAVYYDEKKTIPNKQYDENGKVIEGRAKDEIIKYYLPKYESGAMTYADIEKHYENAVKNPIENPNKLNRKLVKNPEMNKTELDVSIQNEIKENPIGVSKAESNLNKIIHGNEEKDDIDEILVKKSVSNKKKSDVNNIFDDINVDKQREKQLKKEQKEREKELKKQKLQEELKKQQEEYDALDEEFKKMVGKGIRKLKKGRGNMYEAPEALLNYRPQKQMININDIRERGEQIADEVAESNSRVRDALGYGVLGFAHKKIKIGKGLELEPEPKFINFGKYLLNKPHLYNDSKLTLRFPSGGAIPTIKPVSVSEDFKEFLIDLIESGKANEPLYKSVPKEEKLFFQKVMKGAGLVHKLGVKQIPDDSDAKDLARYKLLFGELEAGNNNKQMIAELKGLIMKFMSNGRMKRTEGQNLLFELSQI